MKMMYGGTPVKALNINYFEQDTNDATLQPSDLQSGITAYARGQKVTGTGKSFEFADYGAIYTNFPLYIPNTINIIEIASITYPIKMSIELRNMKDTDFHSSQNIGSVVVDAIEYPITLDIQDNLLTLSCEQGLSLQIFYGRNNYI